MYSKFYGFSHKPFELTPDPDLVFLSETHQEALSVLLYGVYNRKGFLQISGKVGTGKSTLVQALIRKLENNVIICHIPNPHFTVAEFYYYIGAKFDLDEFDGNKAKFILNLAEFLKQCREKGNFALLIIDEAQVLSLELLEEIRLLSNQEYTEFGVLSIFFVGQPELNALLNHEKMEPLRNRIGIRFNLEPLTLDETVAYIQFRLRKAGCTTRLFSPKAMQKIHEASGGIPRSINILCDNSLLAGFAEQRGIIDESIIVNCVKEIEQPDLESVLPDSLNISLTVQQEQASPISFIRDAHKEAGKNNIKIKPNALWKRSAFALAVISALFLAMTYTTDYWGQLPGAAPIKAWFEKVHDSESVIIKLKKLFSTVKIEAQPGISEKNISYEKGIASTGHQEESHSALNKTVTETKSVAEPAEKSLPMDSLHAETIKSEINPAPTNQNAANQSASSQREIIRGGIAGSVEQSEIKRNPDETSYITITRQIESEPGNKSLPPNAAIAQPSQSIQKADEIRYVSITSQVRGANIRTGPSMDDTVMWAVIPGYPFRIIGQHKDWSLVEDFKKRKGWVFSALIDENRTVILMSDKVNLRSGPSYHEDIVTNMDYGTVLQVEEERGSWLRVNKDDGIGGWIHEDKAWP